MKTLELANGDLVVGPIGHATVTGSRRIRQDLALAMGEPIGNDRFHPEFGSVLPSYIGSPIDEETELLVEAEVNRVLQTYIGSQVTEVTRDVQDARRSRYLTADIVTEVVDIQAEVSYDTIRVKLLLRTQSGEQIAIARTVQV